MRKVKFLFHHYYYQLFHDQIITFRQEIINNYNRGLLIDIHGHGHPIQRIELGYLILIMKRQLR